MSLPDKLKHLPDQPGIYVFTDASGKKLYVGKAKNLKQRVKSYFQRTADLEPRKQIMVEKITDLDYTVVDNETEALLLEANFIQKYTPPFNVVMKDDKSFLYIKVTLGDEFPRVFPTRQVNLRDKAKYYGPYVSAGAVYSTLRLLHKIFLYRICEKLPKSPCLEYHMGRCVAPCIQLVSKENYAQIIKGVMEFLDGRTRSVQIDLQRKMKAAASAKQFEQAAAYRDQLAAIIQLEQKQKVISPRKESADYVSVFREGGRAAMNVFQVREGKLVQKLNFMLQQVEDVPWDELLQSAIDLYVARTPQRPKDLFSLLNVTRGKKKKLLQLGEENAREFLRASLASWQRADVRAKESLGEVAQALGLTERPRRIEVYDISNFQGTHAVGSMIVFTNGLPDKKMYRKFKIKTVQGSNDFAMLQEVFARRFSRLRAGSERAPDADKWPKPDLVIVDGGKGQLSSAKQILDHYKLEIPLAGLAKRNEELYIPGQSEPIILPRDSAGLHLVQHMRDEAHRFAIGFYRSLHMKDLLES